MFDLEKKEVAAANILGGWLDMNDADGEWARVERQIGCAGCQSCRAT